MNERTRIFEFEQLPWNVREVVENFIAFGFIDAHDSTVLKNLEHALCRAFTEGYRRGEADSWRDAEYYWTGRNTET